jgi:ABC-type transport system involved in multi-copper enzyme maturation permease subunit/alpha-tubulin suppressor-like RCC1 family protein
MNALLKKEIRLLLPSFGICCALALTNFFFRFNSDGSLQNWWWFMLSFVFCGAVAMMLALNSFGAEISSGTFSNLLAQPVSRQKIWDTKISLLAASLFIVGVFWSGCGIVRLIALGRQLNLLDLFAGIGSFGLVVFSGGLWTVLLLRQVAAAFWFTLLVPGVIMVIIAGLFADQSGEFVEGITVSALGIYSLAGFFFARWLFFRAQDLQWTGGTIELPEMKGFPRLLAVSGLKRNLRPRMALLVKEFQLHQAQFILAGVLLLLHLVVIAMREYGNYQRNSSTEFIIEIFWGLWLVMPFLVGCAAVAEERKLGTLEGHLCLPVKRRTQFAMKFSVVLLLSVLFGVAMPLLLEGTRILPDIHFKFNPVTAITGLQGVYGWQLQMSTAQIVFWNYVEEINVCLPFLLLTGLAAAIGAISFYASTFARNTLQALAPAVLVMILAGFALGIGYLPEEICGYPLWRGWLVYFIGIPIIIFTLARLAFWNYKRVVVGWNGVRRNLFVLVSSLALVVALTTAVYHRAWEKLTPFEPTHGAARLSQSNPTMLKENWGGETSAQLPGGKIWLNHFMPNFEGPNPIAFILGNFKVASFDNGHFLDGSNWSDVFRTRFQSVGLKTDGTLWASKFPQLSDLYKNGKPSSDWEKLSQFGDETNWSSAAPSYDSVLLVKNDGTLWRWGVTNFDFNHKKWPGLQAFTPYQIGTESDWEQVFQLNNYVCLRKKNGSVWMQWYDDQDKVAEKIEIEPEISFGRVTSLETGDWSSTAEMRYGWEYRVGVRSNGTFRLWSAQQFNKSQKIYEQVATDLQIGSETNWLAVAGWGEKIVTLKRDGSLWLWDFHYDWRRGWDEGRGKRGIVNTTPVRLGTHSDWIAITDNDGGITSLADDGSLWFWPLERSGFYADFYGNIDDFEPLLDISHKPQFLGNIFAKPD